MRLYEFDNSAGAQANRVVVLVNKLKDDLEAGKIPDDFNVDDLIEFFRKNEVVVDRPALYDMVEQHPLKKLIHNIQGDEIVFRDESSDTDQPKDKSKEIVSKMAQKAVDI